jgi:Arc/MetJ-type ribon-helix-helix transcriptional regulator
MQRTVELPEEQLKELEQLAAREHRSLDEVVQVALGDYLARRKRDRSDWVRRPDDAVASIRAGIPADSTSEEIEADVMAAWSAGRLRR